MNLLRLRRLSQGIRTIFCSLYAVVSDSPAAAEAKGSLSCVRGYRQDSGRHCLYNVVVVERCPGIVCCNGHSVPSDASISEGRQAMRMAVDSSGNPINAAPRYLPTPAIFETSVEQLLATLHPATPDVAVTAGTRADCAGGAAAG
jgi:hypothetical protein